MADSKSKDQSELVQSVLALDSYFHELERLGSKIIEMELKSEFDLEHTQRLINHFAECGESISAEVGRLSSRLTEVRLKAEDLAQKVSAKANELNSRDTEKKRKLDEFN